ncbi:MAG: Rrf2 family transcriptional regulator [Leptospiraceae bacterium]|nr:Rrf2 family transcriptional regulator [Leptospiraceae bacterium]MDW7977128.1 Rrf2 family transcriptional regulator [Leptospiraceae bacterium]
MKITSKGRYGIKILLDLVKNSNENHWIKSKEISERQNIPIKYLEQIMNILKKCGYVESSRGADGGYRLSKEPEAITLYEVLKCLEGDLSILDPKSDISSGRAGLFWKEIDEKIQEMLSINLKEFLNKLENQDDVFMYYI